MKINIYVNWDNREVCTETEYKAKLTELKNDEVNFEDYQNDYLTDEIDDYIRYQLNRVTNTINVFNLTEEDRKNIFDNLRKNYEKQAEDDMETDWEEFEIEV